MTALRVSVVIVSQGRPDDLGLCLTSLHQQLDAPPFEIIVVGDDSALRVVENHAVGSVAKTQLDLTTNISVLRNRGIAIAAGDIIAFIDDDAVALPNWLRNLTRPFQDPDVQAAGGYVRNPDGVTYQWKRRKVLPNGQCAAVQDAATGQVIKLEGTNMAVRASWFAANGGFDRAYAFYLDETDLCMRLSGRDGTVKLVNDADVIHGFSAGPRRRADRVPSSLAEIGASLAVFTRKWHAQGQRQAAFDIEYHNQRRRLLRWMVAGLIEPRGVSDLLESLSLGWAAGNARPVDDTQITASPVPFQPMETRYSIDDIQTFQGHHVRRRRLINAAKTVARQNTTRLVLTSLLFRTETLRLHPSGVWIFRRRRHFSDQEYEF